MHAIAPTSDFNTNLSHSEVSPPHTILETDHDYVIVLNLLGVSAQDIGIRLQEAKREITIFARKNSPLYQSGFFWVFGTPSESSFSDITTRYRGGALEIRVPKSRTASRTYAA